MEILGKYSWPGNVRELENILHSSSVISKGKRILSKDLPTTLISDIDKSSITESKSTEEVKNLETAHHTEEPTCSKASKVPFKLKNRIAKSISRKASQKHRTFHFTAPSSISSEESFDMAYAPENRPIETLLKP